MRNSKGITLIALIITIIVMLILVGVTVNVAMQGGLFGTAREASSETTRQAEKDQLVSAVLGGLQTGGTFDITKASLPAGAKWITSKTDDTKTSPTLGSGNWVMTDSGNKFYVDKDGNVLDDKPVEEVNIWVTERGLSSNFKYGTWYKFEDGDKWMILYTDGSYAQLMDDDVTIQNFTKEDIDNYIKSGAFEMSGNEVTAVNQWKCVLNEDGTLTRLMYDSDVGAYSETGKTLRAE